MTIMNKTFLYIPILLLLGAIGHSCSKTAAPVISPQIDQAFIQDIAVTDTAGKDVTVSKTFPKPVVDSSSGIEGIGSPVPNPVNVTVKVKAGTDLTNLRVRFVLSGQSKYAAVSPALGFLQDCTKPLQYTISSLTGANRNNYAVQIGF